MTDDVTITKGASSTPPDGTVIATDDVGGIHYQKLKLALGADGAVNTLLDSGQQTKANSAPVVIASDQDALQISGRWGSGAGEVDEVRIDGATNTLQTIEYEHHEIHSGSTYNIKDVVDLSINNVRDIQITTPDTTKWTHFTFSISTESETDWYLYENVTINVAGTTKTPLNADRNSANISGLTVKTIDNTSTANANADTAVAGATELSHGICGSGKDAGELNHGHEIVLKQNEDYCLRFIASTAGYVNYRLDWYEHTNKH